jgi:hypothetical protein
MVYLHIILDICMVYLHANLVICMVYLHANLVICMVYLHVNLVICMIYLHASLVICMVYLHVNLVICIVYLHVKLVIYLLYLISFFFVFFNFLFCTRINYYFRNLFFSVNFRVISSWSLGWTIITNLRYVLAGFFNLKILGGKGNKQYSQNRRRSHVPKLMRVLIRQITN